MSGTGTGRGSGRAHFRSKSGCCICGTKSSSSRFTASERYAEHFGNCFGDGAANRSGDLCNACVLCVKRWLSRGKEIGRFRQVLDSKQGPGPKHMKEIAKRARRREAKKHQQQLQKHLDPHNSQSFSSRVTGNGNSSNRTTSISKNSHLLSSTTTNKVSTPIVPSSSSRSLNNSQQHHSNYGHHLATCVACWAHQNTDTKVLSVNSPSANGNGLVKSSATTSTPLANAGGGFHPPFSGVNVVRTRSSVSRKLDVASRNTDYLAKSEFGCLNNLAECSTSSSASSLRYTQGHSDSSSFISASLSRLGSGESISESHSQIGLQHSFEHFRPPRPPPGISHHSGGVVVGNVSGANGNGNPSGVGVLTRAAASAASNSFAGFFDGGASSTCSSTTSTPSTPTRRQNRRTKLLPVKISSSGVELDDILRKIQKDSKNLNLDNHQINMAVQREIRLRNRIINPPPIIGSGSLIRTPSTSSVNENLGNLTTAASTTTFSDGASVEGNSVDAAFSSAANLRV